MPPREWSMAKAQFAVLFGERQLWLMAGYFLPQGPSSKRQCGFAGIGIDCPVNVLESGGDRLAVFQETKSRLWRSRWTMQV